MAGYMSCCGDVGPTFQQSLRLNARLLWRHALNHSNALKAGLHISPVIVNRKHATISSAQNVGRTLSQ